MGLWPERCVPFLIFAMSGGWESPVPSSQIFSPALLGKVPPPSWKEPVGGASNQKGPMEECPFCTLGSLMWEVACPQAPLVSDPLQGKGLPR